jgi:hypothetical protein
MNFTKLITAFIVSIAFTTGASAVEMARCPATISVNVEGIQALSDAAINKQFEDRGYSEDVQIVMGLRDLLATSAKNQNLTFELTRKEHSQCGYLLKGATASDRTDQLAKEARFYTTNGTNVLRVALNLSETEVANIFLIVSDYSTSSLTAKKSQNAGIYGYSNSDSDHRGVRFVIGKAKNVSAR